MFPDNPEINTLLNNFKTLNSNSNNSSTFNTISNGRKKKDISKVDNTKYTISTANFDKSNISNYSAENNYRKAYSCKSRPKTQNDIPTATKTEKDENTASFTINKNKEQIIEQKVKEYRLKMNRELLDFLAKEKQKEACRERQLEELEYNDPKRAELENQFGKERAISSMMITKKNE